jgi:peptide/nickel transport system substrate-binding protein
VKTPLTLNHAWLGICSAIILTACAPAAPSGGPGQPNAPAAPAAPKNLTIGIQRGLPDFSPFSAQSVSTSSSNIPPMVTDGLTYVDDRGIAHPLKAVELPSLETGTWKLFDDGRMETTWKLKPNIFWHDGTPQTSEDYRFTFQVSRDKELPRSLTSTVLAQSGISFPDPLTVVISWGSPHIDAGTTGPSAGNPTGLLPKHILGESYEQDKTVAFLNHPYWSHEYVSDGPYKISKFDLGADMELVRNEQYYLGRPPFDRVVVRVIGDANALVSNILAGALDVVLPPGISTDSAVEVRNRWQGTGNEARADVVGRIIHFEVQFRPDQAKPQLGFTEAPVRQALYQSINRTALAEYMTSGFGPLADSWYRPDEPRRAELQIPQFAYDPPVAPALLAQVGWTKGADGVLTNSRTGEPFKASIWANQAASWDKLGYAVAEDWKPLGIETEVFPIPPARTGDREFEQGYTGLFVTNVNEEQFFINRLHSSVIPSPSTRFVGSNRGGHNNPQVDALYDRLVATIDPRQRTPIERELVKVVMGGLVMMPFYWETLPVLKVKGIKDHKVKTGNSTWFFYDWNRE